MTLTCLISVFAEIRPSLELMAHLSALCMLEEMTLSSYTGGLRYHVHSAFKLPEQHGALKQGHDWYLAQLVHE